MSRRYLQCTLCPARADMQDVHTISGWMIAPRVVCAECIERQLAEREATPKATVETSSYRGRVIHTLHMDGDA